MPVRPHEGRQPIYNAALAPSGWAGYANNMGVPQVEVDLAHYLGHLWGIPFDHRYQPGQALFIPAEHLLDHFINLSHFTNPLLFIVIIAYEQFFIQKKPITYRLSHASRNFALISFS
jgi:hypothetical protein